MVVKDKTTELEGRRLGDTGTPTYLFAGNIAYRDRTQFPLTPFVWEPVHPRRAGFTLRPSGKQGPYTAAGFSSTSLPHVNRGNPQIHKNILAVPPHGPGRVPPLRYPYHCGPGHLGNPGVSHGDVDNEEEDGEDPVKDSYKHYPAKSRDSEILSASDERPHQQSQDLQSSRDGAERGGRKEREWNREVISQGVSYNLLCMF